MRTSLLPLLILVFCMLFTPGKAQSSRSGYLALDADSLFYEEAGSGPVLVFIHDGLLHGEVWDESFSFFSTSHRVIRYDRRGYGRSSPATSSYTHLNDLESLLAHLQVDQAVLLAMSSGGALAIDFTLDHPEQVEALVLVGAVVGGFSYTWHMKKRGGHLPSGFKSELEEAIYYAAEDPYEIHPENVDARKKALDMVRKFPPKDNRRPSYVKREIPSYLRLREISQPALILVGEFDIPDVHAHAGAIQAGIPGAKRDILPGAGHLVPLEQAKRFNVKVADFLGALPE